MNHTFGPLAFANLPRVETPVGETCFECEEPIAEGDSGILMFNVALATPLGHAEPAATAKRAAAHRECHLRALVGSVGHQRGLCSCNGGPGTMDDPPGATKREAALLAEREFFSRHGGEVS